MPSELCKTPMLCYTLRSRGPLTLHTKWVMSRQQLNSGLAAVLVLQWMWPFQRLWARRHLSAIAAPEGGPQSSLSEKPVTRSTYESKAEQFSCNATSHITTSRTAVCMVKDLLIIPGCKLCLSTQDACYPGPLWPQARGRDGGRAIPGSWAGNCLGSMSIRIMLMLAQPIDSLLRTCIDYQSIRVCFTMFAFTHASACCLIDV